MNSLDSKTGKRNSRKNFYNKVLVRERKRARRLSIVGLILLVFACLLFVFFARALKIGLAKDTAKPDYGQVLQSVSKLDRLEAFQAYSQTYQKMEARGQLKDMEEVIEARSDYSQDLARSRNPGVLKGQLIYYLDRLGISQEDVALVYYNLESSSYMGINESQTFPAGPLIDLALVRYIFDQAHSERIDLDDKVMVRDWHLVGGARGQAGSIYSLGDLARLVTEDYDPLARNVLSSYLIRKEGRPLLETLADRYNISTYEGNYMTADEAVLILQQVYENENLNPYYYDLVYYMEDSKEPSYLDKSIGDNKLAHRIADQEEALGEIGIVYDDDFGHYAYAIYIQGQEAPGPLIGQLGSIIHDWHRGRLSY